MRSIHDLYPGTTKCDFSKSIYQISQSTLPNVLTNKQKNILLTFINKSVTFSHIHQYPWPFLNHSSIATFLNPSLNNLMLTDLLPITVLYPFLDSPNFSYSTNQQFFRNLWMTSCQTLVAVIKNQNFPFIIY